MSQDFAFAPYTRLLIPDATGGYSAEVLEFPGCYAQGETATEAMDALDRAAAAWMAAAQGQGQGIPPPLHTRGYGGKIALRLPRSIHRQAAHLARYEGVSLNAWLLTAIAVHLGAQEDGPPRLTNAAQAVVSAYHAARGIESLGTLRDAVHALKAVLGEEEK